MHHCSNEFLHIRKCAEGFSLAPNVNSHRFWITYYCPFNISPKTWNILLLLNIILKATSCTNFWKICAKRKVISVIYEHINLNKSLIIASEVSDHIFTQIHDLFITKLDHQRILLKKVQFISLTCCIYSYENLTILASCVLSCYLYQYNFEDS